MSLLKVDQIFCQLLLMKSIRAVTVKIQFEVIVMWEGCYYMLYNYRRIFAHQAYNWDIRLEFKIKDIMFYVTIDIIRTEYILMRGLLSLWVSIYVVSFEYWMVKYVWL